MPTTTNRPTTTASKNAQAGNNLLTKPYTRSPMNLSNKRGRKEAATADQAKLCKSPVSTRRIFHAKSGNMYKVWFCKMAYGMKILSYKKVVKKYSDMIR